MDRQRSIALITGGSSGIGEAIVRELADTGYFVIVISDISESDGIALVNEINSICPDTALYKKVDVSDEMQVQSLFQYISSRFGRLDVLINCAGINMDAMVENIDQIKWQRVLDVNLTGTFLCVREAVPLMKKIGYGRILNISSIVAEMGNIGQANYSAAKGGVISLTKTVAREVAKYGITVNAIAPGYIKTRMITSIPNHVADKLINQIPMKRFGEPVEVAKLARFLVSKDASYITGNIANINGGLYM